MNNVHALNFAPGEVRLDVSMDSSLQLLKEKISSPKYNEILSAGREQLQTLRREQLLEEEKERTAISERNEMKANMQRERQMTRWNVDGDKQPADSTLPDFVSVGVMGAIGYMAMWRGRKETSDDGGLKFENPTPSLAFANATGSSFFEQTSFGSSLRSMGEEETSLNTVSSIVVNVLDDPNVFEDVPVLSREERIEAANKAMEEYLNRDDGSGAWLDTMKDIMNED